MKTVFNMIAPLPGNDEKVHPMDLVKQLGRVRRFNGSADPEWTVLHHSMLVAILWLQSYGPEGIEHATFHDAHEYVTGDIPSPVKVTIGRDAIEKLESFLDDRIYAMLKHQRPDGFDRPFIKNVDWAALFIEAYYIGLPGHVRHIIDTSILHLSPEQRQAVAEVVRHATPEVLETMKVEGFFEAPYEAPKAKPEGCGCCDGEVRAGGCS